MSECIFCKIFKEEQGVCPENKVIFKGKFFYLRFDDMPVSPGHMEIVPKRHVAILTDLKAEEWSELKDLINKSINEFDPTALQGMYEKFIENPGKDKIKEYAQKMLKHGGLGSKPDGYNIGVNQGEAAGQTIGHLHVHIIPRYEGDVENPVGGVRNVIEEMGNYKK